MAEKSRAGRRASAGWALDARHVVFAEPVDFSRRAVDLSSPAVSEELWGSGGEVGASFEEETFLRWLFARAQLDVRDYRIETLKRRIGPCLRLLRVKTTEEARQVLKSRPERLSEAVSTILLGVTSFFRDPAVFGRLQDEILPAMVKRIGRPLRVWSAGCSDGAELYSLVMALKERGLLMGRGETFLGTDCRPDALARAREGRYSVMGLRGLSDDRIATHFQWVGGSQWRIKQDLRSRCCWRMGNLLSQAEPGTWDVILCRNMFMYLRGQTATRMWGVLERQLTCGGMLVVGKAERPSGTLLSMVGPCIYRRDRG